MYLHEKYSEEGVLKVNELVAFLEDDLLNYETFPDEYFSSIKYIFNTEKFWATPSLWKVLHMLTSEALTENQFLDISEILASKFGDYEDSMLCDMSCDFICRVCHLKDSLRLLDKIAKTGKNEQHAQAIVAGVNILKHRDDYDSSANSRLDRVLVSAIK